MLDGKLNWDYEKPFLMDFVAREEHIDGLNHVNNGVYVNWCQDVGWAHSVSLGLDMTSYHELDRAMVIRHSEYDYKAAAYLGEPLRAATWLTGNDGRLAMERRFQLVRVSDGATLLRARWQLVCIEISSGRPRRMPEVFNRQYGVAVIELETP